MRSLKRGDAEAIGHSSHSLLPRTGPLPACLKPEFTAPDSLGPSTHAPGRLEYENVGAAILEFGRRGEPGESSPDNDDIDVMAHEVSPLQQVDEQNLPLTQRGIW
jgi:hypothetical protein